MAQALRWLRWIALATVLAAGLTASASAGQRSAARATPSCHLELQFNGYRYSPTAVPEGSVQAGAPLRTNALLRCEESMVCKRAQPCTATGGRIDAILRPLRVRGIRARIALIDPRTNRFYLNPAAFCRNGGFPHCLRRARLHPAPHPDNGRPSTLPPPAEVVGSNRNLELARSSYCWSKFDDKGGVTGCGLAAPPRARTGPLIVAEPGATVRISLGFEPASVLIYAAGRRFEPAASRDLTLKVPAHPIRRSFLLLDATRMVNGRPTADHASYVARVRISR